MMDNDITSSYSTRKLPKGVILRRIDFQFSADIHDLGQKELFRNLHTGEECDLKCNPGGTFTGYIESITRVSEGVLEVTLIEESK